MALLKDLTVYGATRLVADTFAAMIYADGFHHNSHDNNDSVLLAGGSYKLISDFSSSGHNHGVSKTAWGQTYVNSSGQLQTISGNISSTGTITPSTTKASDVGTNALSYRYVYTTWVGAPESTALQIGANNANHIYINTSGSIGIGTTSPSYKLHVAGALYASSYIYSPDIRGGQVRLISNWVGFYSAENSTTTRYGYIQTNDTYMYFRKENGNSGFNFNGHLVPASTNSHNLGTNTLRWSTLYLNGSPGINYIMSADTSNARVPLCVTNTSNTQIAEIGYHNTGDTNGAFVITPYAHSGTDFWGGTIGLYIGKNNLKWENKYILRYSATATSGNVIIADGTVGNVKTSSYSISATINAGTANRVAWYNGSAQLASSSIVTDGGYLGSISYLSINTAHQTSYRLYVNGAIYTNSSLYISNSNSLTNGIIFPATNKIYRNNIYNEYNIGLFGYNSIFNGLKDNVSYVEYYNGSSWVAWQQDSSYTFMKPAFNGLRRGNGVSIDHTHRQFRIIVETASAYCGTGYLCFRLSWWNHGTMETSGGNTVPLKVSLDWGNANSSSATFTNIFTDITTTAAPEGYYLIPCTLHYDHMASIRLTIKIPSWANTGNSTSLCDVVFASWFGGTAYTSKFSLSDHTHTWASITSKPAATGSAYKAIYWNGSTFVETNRMLNAVSDGTYWGMRNPDGGDSWLRTSTSGLIPSTSGGEWSGHSSLGTSSWYFGNIYTQYLNEIHIRKIAVNNSTSWATNFDTEVFGAANNTNYKLSILRMNANAPEYVRNNYATGIAWKGSDTKGVMSVAYNTPAIRWAGGSGTSDLTWWLEITGTSGESYNLNELKDRLYTDKAISTTGWYRVLNITTYGCDLLMSVAGSYIHYNPGQSTFIISVGYDNGKITQLSNPSLMPYISKIRLVRYAAGKHYIDVYYNQSAENTPRLTFKNLGLSRYNTALALVAWTAKTETLESGETLDASITVSHSVNTILDNLYTSRQASMNVSFGDGSLRVFKATSSTTTGKPAWDAHIIHLAWDNTSGHDSQIAVGTASQGMQYRGQNSGTWGDWKTLLDSSNYTSYVNNYYWANVKVSTTSSTTTTPTVKQLIIGSDSTNDIGTDAYIYFYNGSGNTTRLYRYNDIFYITRGGVATAGIAMNASGYIGLGVAPDANYRLKVNNNSLLIGTTYFGSTSYWINNSGAEYMSDIRASRLRLIENWIGFYTSNNVSGNRLGYIQTDGYYMYFRKENGNSGFNFNGNLVPSSNLAGYIGTSAAYWKAAYIMGYGGQIYPSNLYFNHMWNPTSGATQSNYETSASYVGIRGLGKLYYDGRLGNKIAAMPLAAITVNVTNDGSTWQDITTNTNTATNYNIVDRILAAFYTSVSIAPGKITENKTDYGTNGTHLASLTGHDGVEVILDFTVENRTGYIDVINMYQRSYLTAGTFSIDYMKTGSDSWTNLYSKTLTTSQNIDGNYTIYLGQGLYMNGVSTTADNTDNHIRIKKLKFKYLSTAIGTGNNIRYAPLMGTFAVYGRDSVGFGSVNSTYKNSTGLSRALSARDIPYTVSVSSTRYGLSSTVDKANDAYLGNVAIPCNVSITDDCAYTKANVDKRVYLVLGNSSSISSDGIHCSGSIRLFGQYSNYTEIRSNVTSNGNRYFFLPNYAGNMYATHIGTEDAVGNGTKPVYVATSGRVTASSSTVGTIFKPVYMNSGTITECTYYLQASVNSGTSGHISYYNSNGQLSASQLLTDTFPSDIPTAISGVNTYLYCPGNAFVDGNISSSYYSTKYANVNKFNIGKSTDKYNILYTSRINSADTNGSVAQAGGDSGTSASPNRYKPQLWKFTFGWKDIQDGSTTSGGFIPKNGDIITIKIPGAGHDYGVFLSTNNGTNYYPITLTGTERLTTHFPTGSYVTLLFDSSNSAASMFPVNGGDSRQTITGGTWRVLNYYDSGFNEWNLRQYTIKANAAITAVHIIGGTDNGYKNIDSASMTFDIRYPVLYAGSSISSGSTGSNNFIHHYAINIQNSSNSNIAFTSYKNVYIKGTINGTIFTPISGGNPYVQTITASDDGYVYYYIGRAYSNSAITFDGTGKDIYVYKNSTIQRWNGYSVNAASAASATNATNTTNVYLEGASGNVDYAMLFTTATGNGYGRIYGDTQWRSALTFNPSSNLLMNKGNAQFNTILPNADNTYSLGSNGSSGLTWNYLFVNNILCGTKSYTGGSNESVSNGVAIFGNGSMYIHRNTAGEGLRLNGIYSNKYGTYAQLYISTISTSTTTCGTATLTLGNSDVSGTQHFANGTIKLYSKTAHCVTIKTVDDLGYSKNLLIPSYNGDMYIVHASSTSAVGNSTTPVYIAANGRVTQCSSFTISKNTGVSANRYVVGTDSTSGNFTTAYCNSCFYFNSDGAYHSSDIKLKYDIRDILNEDINKLFETENGFIRHYKWKETNKDAYGFIAQELLEYCPEAVDFNTDNELYSVNYNVAFSKIIGAMFKKIKEQEQIIQQLKEKVLQ